MITSQLEMSFESPSPINRERLGGQNKRLYDYLATGKTIHVFDPAKRQLQIGYLNTRISDLKKAGVEVYKRGIQVPDMDGNIVSVIEYSLNPFS